MADTFNEELLSVDTKKAYEDLVDNIIGRAERPGQPIKDEDLARAIKQYRQATGATVDDLDSTLSRAVKSEDFKNIKNRIGLHQRGLIGQKPVMGEENIFFGLKGIREYINTNSRAHSLLPTKTK